MSSDSTQTNPLQVRHSEMDFLSRLHRKPSLHLEDLRNYFRCRARDSGNPHLAETEQQFEELMLATREMEDYIQAQDDDPTPTIPLSDLDPILKVTETHEDDPPDECSLTWGRGVAREIRDLKDELQKAKTDADYTRTTNANLRHLLDEKARQIEGLTDLDLEVARALQVEGLLKPPAKEDPA